MKNGLFKVITVWMISIVFSTESASSNTHPSARDTGPDDPPRSYVIGLAPGMNGDDQSRSIQAIRDLVMASPAGTRTQVFNAISDERVADFLRPDSRSARLIYRQIAPGLKQIEEFMEQSKSVRSGQDNAIDIPRFLDLIGQGLRGGSAETTVILIGSPFYVSPSEPEFSFGPGFVPSPGHLFLDGNKSIYGTADKAGALDGVVVHWATLGTQASTIELRAVQEFWAWSISEQGGVLSTFATHPDAATERAQKGASDSVRFSPIDRDDLKPEIRSLSVLDGDPIEPVDPDDKVDAAPVQEDVQHNGAWSGAAAMSPTPLLIINIDGSGSMSRELANVTKNILQLARDGARTNGEIKISIVVFRQEGLHSVLPPTVIRNPIADGVTDRGMQALIDFLTKKDLAIATGDTENPFRYHTRMDPFGNLVDVKHALDGIHQFVAATATKDAPILISYCSDTGPWETNGTTDIEPNERLVAEELLADLGHLMEEYPNARVIAVNTGRPTSSLYKPESAEFIKGMADAAGDRGTYATEVIAILYGARDFFNDNK